MKIAGRAVHAPAAADSPVLAQAADSAGLALAADSADRVLAAGSEVRASIRRRLNRRAAATSAPTPTLEGPGAKKGKKDAERPRGPIPTKFTGRSFTLDDEKDAAAGEDIPDIDNFATSQPHDDDKDDE